MGFLRYQIALTAIWLYITIEFCVDSEVRIEQIEVTPENAREGDDVLLKCNINVFESNHVLSWSKNGQRITRDSSVVDTDLRKRQEDEEVFFNFDSNPDPPVAYSHINFKTINRYDSGTYACEVYIVEENTERLVKLESVDLDVVYVPSDDYPTCNPSGEIFINIGRPLTLSCLSEEGNPRVNLTWKRTFGDNNFVLIEATVTTNEGGFVTSEYIIPEVSLDEQDSVFVCSLPSTEVSRICSLRTQVVLPEPLISISPQMGITYVGESIEFTCSSSFFTMENRFYWTTEPNMVNRTTISANRNTSTLRISGITAMENGTVILCTLMFRRDWIRTTSKLYIMDERSNVTTPRPKTIGSSTVGSPIAWMIAFIVVSVIAAVGFIVCFLRIKQNSDKNGEIVNQNRLADRPYVINRIHDGEEPYYSQSMEHIDNLEGDPGPIVDPGPTSELENPAYMAHGVVRRAGAPGRPIQIRNMSHVSEASTVEPDYMPVEM